MGTPAGATAPTSAVAGRTDTALARLETAASALVRWSESKHIRTQVAELSGCDIAPSVMRLLEHFDLSGPMRVSDVAQCLGIDISTASLQLRPLRQDELVTRTSDPHDGRIAMITITPKGQDVLSRVRAVRQQLLGEALGPTSAAEIQQAADTLLRIQESILRSTAEVMLAND